MFLDHIRLTVHAGKGGDGLVHFARRKFQAFGGPDGGDGGNGGSVILVCDRAIDDLDHLRTAKTDAAPGQPGGPKQMIGFTAPDHELRVPPGTLVYDSQTQDELAMLTATGQRYVAAQGGKGGKGNPKYATGRRRAPKLAEPGEAGVVCEIDLAYRLYCDTLLLEAEGDPECQLLPQLLHKEPEDIDWDVYRRKPRWVRIEHDFQRYDVGYLPFSVDDEGNVSAPLLPHVFWAKRIVVNMLPVGGAAPSTSTTLEALIRQQPLRRLETIQYLPAENGLAGFLQQLTGGIVP